MDADVRRDVITLDSGGSAGIPLASEIQVVGAFASNMFLTNVFLGEAVNNQCVPTRFSCENLAFVVFAANPS